MASTSRENALRLFIIEAPSPMDLLQKRGETPALAEACALIGHEVATLVARSSSDLGNVCQYISDIDSDQDEYDRERIPLCVHIAAHGNKAGLAFGKDLVEWDELFDMLKPLCAMRDYDGEFILVISACEATKQKLTAHLRKKASGSAMRPPIYVFTTADAAPSFADALVSWVVFYHQLPRVSLTERDDVKAVLKRVKAAGGATLKYSRWDQKKMKYLNYTPAK